jgi:hypothetical protein
MSIAASPSRLRWYMDSTMGSHYYELEEKNIKCLINPGLDRPGEKEDGQLIVSYNSHRSATHGMLVFTGCMIHGR